MNRWAPGKAGTRSSGRERVWSERCAGVIGAMFESLSLPAPRPFPDCNAWKARHSDRLRRRRRPGRCGLQRLGPDERRARCSGPGGAASRRLVPTNGDRRRGRDVRRGARHRHAHSDHARSEVVRVVRRAGQRRRLSLRLRDGLRREPLRAAPRLRAGRQGLRQPPAYGPRWRHRRGLGRRLAQRAVHAAARVRSQRLGARPRDCRLRGRPEDRVRVGPEGALRNAPR